MTYTGTVSRFNVAKGYGFITTEVDSFFVHRSNVIPDANGFQSLKAGDLVQFESGPGNGGKIQAVKVQRISEGAANAPVAAGESVDATN